MIVILQGTTSIWADLRYKFSGGTMHVTFLTPEGVEVDSQICGYLTQGNYTKIDISGFSLEDSQYTMNIGEGTKDNVVYTELVSVKLDEESRFFYDIAVEQEKTYRP